MTDDTTAVAPDPPDTGDKAEWGCSTERTPAMVNHTDRKRMRILLTVGALFTVTALLTLTFAGLSFAQLYSKQRALWDPLADYSVQQATPEVHVFAEATSAEIEVSATKCARESVSVYGSATWVSIEPPGSQVIVSTAAVALRPKGCITTTYHNLLPEEVLTRTKQFGGNVIWRLTGVEVPIRADQLGVPAYWETTPIRIEIVDVNGQPINPHR